MVHELYNRWWKITGNTCRKDDKSKESKANSLGVSSIGGVFVVLLSGLAIAIVVAILEFCWNSRKNAQTDRVSNSLIVVLKSDLCAINLIKNYGQGHI